MEVIIDRFEGGFAVVELSDRSMVNLPLQLVPNAKQGDVIKIEIDKLATEKRKANINKIADKIWAD